MSQQSSASAAVVVQVAETPGGRMPRLVDVPLRYGAAADARMLAELRLLVREFSV